MKKKIKRSKLHVVKDIFEKIDDFFECDIDVELADRLVRNIEAIEAELGIIDKNPKLKVPDGYEEYDTKRIDLVKKHADKDESGQVIVNGNEAQITGESRSAFEAEFAELRTSNAELLEAVDEVNKLRAEFMESETEIDVILIPKSSLGKIKKDGKPSGFTLTVFSTIRPFLGDE